MSMKEAKRHAAEQALLNTKYLIPQRKENYDDSKIPPTVVLNNVATKFGMTVTYLSEDELIAEVILILLLLFCQLHVIIKTRLEKISSKSIFNLYDRYFLKKSL